ncbi:hypothetical protein MRS44_013901 [Fusarium solani]|jgi:hypothetical protein|uniref:uncharacterized protein n=1 Tax=Fusarium solani TaxID=169388 RepID=UPI0032C437FA|nr:hypothetical protein MRS44_018388 [Fusarium solani]KAJ3453972.1 hypothetical protein MRS44_018604 [Fusarium solani]KAJ3455301.1 hypothetical protein MRS44_013901 [Fusarium solani]
MQLVKSLAVDEGMSYADRCEDELLEESDCSDSDDQEDDQVVVGEDTDDWDEQGEDDAFGEAHEDHRSVGDAGEGSP